MPTSVSSRPEFRRRAAAETDPMGPPLALPTAPVWRSEGFAEDLEPTVPPQPAAARDGWRAVRAAWSAAWAMSPPVPRG